MRLITTTFTVALLAATGAGAAASSPPPPPPPLQTQPPSPAEAAELAKNFESRHGLKLLPTAPPPQLKDLRITPLPAGAAGAAAAGNARKAALHLLILDEELARYPAPLLRASGMTAIAFVQQFTLRNSIAPCYPDYESGVFYWNLGFDAQEEYLRHIVHHELFHAIDERVNGQFMTGDPIWSALNDRKFRYGPGGHIVRESYRSDHADASPGFVSRYAAMSVMEDKADTFGLFMSPSGSAWLQQRRRNDPVLGGKIDYLRDLVTYYENLPDTPEQRLLDELMQVVRRDDFRATEQFLKANPSVVDTRGWRGRTPLMRAMLARKTYAPQQLYRSSDKNAADDDGWTALHYAAYLRDTRMVRALIRNGADPQVKDKLGGTPGDWAKLKGHGDVVQAIRDAQQPPPPPSNRRQPPTRPSPTRQPPSRVAPHRR